VIFPHLKALCEAHTEKGHQRAASEVLAGLFRGSKLWTFEQLEHLEKTIKPLMLATIETISPDTLPAWLAGIKFAIYEQDPRRLRWLVNILLNSTLSSESEYAFSETRKLGFLQILLDCYNWRLSAESLQILDHLEQHLSHSYKNIRTQIGALLNRIYFVHWHPVKPIESKLKAFEERVFQKLTQEREASLLLTPEEFLNNPPAYVRLSKTVLCWTFESLNRISVEQIAPIISTLIPHLFMMIETSDQDLSLMAKSVVDKLPHQRFSAQVISKILVSLEKVSNMSSWHIRIKTLPIFSSIVLHNIFLLNKAQGEGAIGLLISKLSDPQLEVRELAALSLSGLVKTSFREKIPSIIELFKKNLKIPLPGKKKIGDSPQPSNVNDSEVILKRHAAVLGLSSVVLAFPFDVPPFLPLVLELLVAHIDDPLPIQSTVKKVMADFRRTHQDTWHLDKEAFSEQQLEILSELLVAPSYYA